MKKKLLLIALAILTTNLFAYTDSDMDGVDDSVDRCPNTSFTDLVDINGCTKKSLASPHHFDIIAGLSYSDSDYNTLNKTDTYSSTIQVDYYYKNFSLQASTSYFDTSGGGYSDTGMYDSFIGGAYQIKSGDDLTIRLGLGILLPTYDSSLNNNNTDYTASVSLSYAVVDDISVFGGYSYTLINDDDVDIVDDSNRTIQVRYQDTNAYYVGVGYYPTNKLYVSASYNTVESIYTSIEDIDTASFYGYYSIDQHWFSTFSYAYGISDSASNNYLSVKLGYFF